jgi:hypothetical protein
MKALAVPSSAIQTEGQMDGVFVADQGLARLRWIQIGVRGGNWVQVLSGLRPGEMVIVPVPAGLRDGQPVEPIAAAAVEPGAKALGEAASHD